MEQPSAVHHAEAAGEGPALATSAGRWESDLADLTGLPLSAVDALPPLDTRARVLQEVLRARHGVQQGGGGEGTGAGGSAQAE
ncbi:hypothetical protein AB0D49_01350 [Streptomyces sp. NPDC048290]|uniref:hypothetical protein n=1 Tax=Streptomyces sp. NPDC048290 TaxID=3155811 RepID=UPI00343BDCA5